MTPEASEMFALDGQVALVTGACGQLGAAFSAALASAGATVVGADLKPDGDRLALDVSDEQSVDALMRRIQDEHGRLDVLVNNAGIGVFTDLADRTIEEIDQVAAVNIRGTILVSRAAAELMPEDSAIVNIASVYGVVSPDPRIYGSSGRNSSEIYGATKAGVVQLTKWFAVHLASRRIRVNCISPGGVFADQLPEFVRAYEQRTPAGRMAQPADLLGGLIYLSSRASRYVTGHNLVIDGGWSSW